MKRQWDSSVFEPRGGGRGTGIFLALVRKYWEKLRHIWSGLELGFLRNRGQHSFANRLSIRMIHTNQSAVHAFNTVLSAYGSCSVWTRVNTSRIPVGRVTLRWFLLFPQGRANCLTCVWSRCVRHLVSAVSPCTDFDEISSKCSSYSTTRCSDEWVTYDSFLYLQGCVYRRIQRTCGQSKDAINYSGYMRFRTRFCGDRSWETIQYSCA